MELLEVRAHLGETLLVCALVGEPEPRWPVTVARAGAAALALGALGLCILDEPALGGAALLLGVALFVLGARRRPEIPFDVKRSAVGVALSWQGERLCIPAAALPLSLTAGELRLELSPAPAPERWPRAARRDPERRALAAFAAGSLALHASVVALALSLPTTFRFGPYSQLSRRPARVALVAVPPRPGDGGALQLWLAQGGEARGARRPGRGVRPRAEGETRGLHRLRGPVGNPDPHLARRLAEQAARGAGVLSLLRARGGALASTGGQLADAFGAGDGRGPLLENQIGESYGVGGLSLLGTGRGGGGTGRGTVLSGSLGTVGRGGGGGGGAGYGRGVGSWRSTGSRFESEGCIPSVVAGSAEARCGGAERRCLDKGMVRKVIRAHINEVRYCYLKELQSYPDGLDGRVTVRFEIQPSGRVSRSRVAATTLAIPTVGDCVSSAVARWLFPRTTGGATTLVTYPFYFRTAGLD